MSVSQWPLQRLGRWRRVAPAAVLSAAVVLIAAAPGRAPADVGTQGVPTITMSGSTSVAPLAARLAQKYVQNHNVQFRLSQGGSDIGISDVAHGRVDIGNSSRDPKPTDPGGITFRKIAKDAICVITNNSNTLPNLSQNGVQAVFSGQVRHWNQVPGATRGSNVIDLFVRNVASGTQDAFEKLFMDPKDVNNSIAKQLASNGLIQQRVKDDANGIGYVSLFFTTGVHRVAYKGVACTLRNAKSGQYGGVRNFWMVTRGSQPQRAVDFIKWVQNSSAANSIIGTNWVPLH